MISFTELYQKYANDVFRFALYLCGSVPWAEDLTSETFVRAWTRQSSLQMPTVKAYLMTIVRNLYLNQARQNKRFMPLDDNLADQTLGPEATVQQRAELKTLLSGLQTLNEIDRAALVMRTLYDMPYVEIAAALAISVSSARVKVHRAKLKMVEYRDQTQNGETDD